jgi:superkiller protein 3
MLGAAQPSPTPHEVPLPDLSDAQSQVHDKIMQRRTALLADVTDANAWGQYAIVLHAHWCIADAALAYEQAARLDPAEFRWPYFHATLLQALEPAPALSRLEAALQINPSYAPALVRRGKLYEQLDRLEEAWTAYNDALQVDPKHAAARLHRGIMALQRGDIENATVDLKLADTYRPGDTAVLTALARAYQRSGDRDTAREVARAAQKAALVTRSRFEDPLIAEVSREAVNLRAYIERAELLEQSGRLNEALAQIQSGLSHNPDHTLLYVALIDVYLRQRDYENAVDAARRVLESDLSVPNIHKSLAISLFELGRLDEAEAEAQLALQENPADGDVHQILGRTYARTNRPDEAIDMLSRSLQLKPDDITARLRLAELLIQQQQPGEATAPLQRVIDARPDDLKAWTLLGIALMQEGKIQGAIEAFEQAYQLARNNPLVIRRLASALGAAGRYEQQLRLLDDAHRQLPQAWGLLNDLAWLLATCSDTQFRDGERAVMLAQKLVHDPARRTPATLDTLAAAYSAMGRYQEAVAAMDQAIALAHQHGIGGERLAAYDRRRSRYEAQRPYEAP